MPSAMLNDTSLASFLQAVGKDKSCDTHNVAAIDAVLSETIQKPDLPDAVAGQAAQLIADACREADRRTTFTADAVTALARVYQRPSLAVADKHQVQRALANLVGDNDTLREVLAGQNAVLKGVVADIKAAKSELMASSLGLLVNFALDFDKGRAMLVKLEVVPTMLHLITAKSEHTQYCLHLLSVLVQNERGRDDLVSHRGIDHLIDLLPTTAAIDDEHTEIIVEILEHASTDNPIVQKRLHARKLHLFLLTYMEDLVNDSINNDEDHSTAIDSALRIVINLTHDNGVAEQLIQDKPTLMKLYGWLTHSDDVLDGKGADLVVCAALCLGNLSRSDKHSAYLVKDFQFTRQLMHILTVCHNAKIHLATLSALRHFSMPAENKVVLGQQGITEVVMPYMLSPIADVSLTAVVIHRLLSADARSMRTMIMTTSPTHPKSSLQVAMDAYEKHADQVAIKCEIGRLVGSLIKSAITHNAPDCLAKVQSLALAPLWNLLALPYVAVYNEAVLSLALILTKGSNPKEIAIPDTFAKDAEKLFGTNTQIEFRINAAQLLLVVQSLHPEYKGKFGEARTIGHKAIEAADASTSADLVENLRKLLNEVL